jgi:hypothetical protein
MASVTATAAAAAADGEDVSPSDLATNNNLQQELPFLVTHWLANYGTNSADTTTNNPPACSQDERQEAMARIRRATSEIASAFATLGAYGTTFRVSCAFMVFGFHVCLLFSDRWLFFCVLDDSRPFRPRRHLPGHPHHETHRTAT